MCSVKLTKIFIGNYEYDGEIIFDKGILLYLFGSKDFEPTIVPNYRTEFDILTGTTINNEHINLHRCVIANCSFNGNEHEYYFYVNHIVFYNKENTLDKIFNTGYSIKIPLANMNAWFGNISGSLEYTLANSELICYSCENNQSFLTLSNYNGISNVEDVYNISKSYSDMFTVLSGAKVYTNGIIQVNNGDYYLKFFHSHFLQQFNGVDSSVSIKTIRNYFLAQLQNPLADEAKLFSKWFSNNINLHFEVAYICDLVDKNLINRSDFLSLVSCFETAARRTKFVDLKLAMREIINYFIECFDIFDITPQYDINNARDTNLYKDGYLKLVLDIKDTRNFYTHLNPDEVGKDKFASKGLLHVNEFMYWIIRLNILRELGVDIVSLKRYCKDNKFKNLVDRIFYDNKLMKKEFECRLNDQQNKILKNFQ